MTRPRHLLALTLLALAILGTVHGRTAVSARASALFSIAASCCFVAASVRL